MRGVDGDALACRDLDPAAGRSPADEDERMQVIALDDGELEIAIIRRGRYLLPYRAAGCV